jgi:hypothetical protein
MHLSSKMSPLYLIFTLLSLAGACKTRNFNSQAKNTGSKSSKLAITGEEKEGLGALLCDLLRKKEHAFVPADKDYCNSTVQGSLFVFENLWKYKKYDGLFRATPPFN